MDFNSKFGSKKSIKSRFEYDLDRISGRPQLDRISSGWRPYKFGQKIRAVKKIFHDWNSKGGVKERDIRMILSHAAPVFEIL